MTTLADAYSWEPLKKTKLCKRCGRVLDVSCFYENKSQTGGLQSWCKECHVEYNRAYNAKKIHPPVPALKPTGARKQLHHNRNYATQLCNWLESLSLDKLNTFSSFITETKSPRKILETFLNEGMPQELFQNLAFSHGYTRLDLGSYVNDILIAKTPKPEPKPERNLLTPETRIIKIEYPRKPDIIKESDPERLQAELLNTMVRIEHILQDIHALFLKLSNGKGAV